MPLRNYNPKNQADLERRNDKIGDDINVICGRCACPMTLDEKDPRTARGFDCTHCRYKTRVYVEYKEK